MSYKYYTDEYKQKKVDEFIDSRQKFRAFCATENMQPKTFRSWVEKDGRHQLTVKPRAYISSKFSYANKMLAVKMRKSGRLLSDIAKIINTSSVSVAKWTKTYETKGGYALMGKEDLNNLPRGNNRSKRRHLSRVKELEQKLKDKQMEIDAYEVVLDILKKCPALNLKKNLKDLKKSIKRVAIQRLRAKYPVGKLLKLFLLDDSTFYKLPKYRNNDEKYAEYDGVVLDWFERHKYSKGKLGRREIEADMREENLEIHTRRLYYLLKVNGWHMIQKKSSGYHKSFVNDGEPEVENLLFDKVINSTTGEKSYTHTFKTSYPMFITGTDVTEFHVNGFKDFLSVIIDMHDSQPLHWKHSRHPDTELILGSFEELLQKYPNFQDAVMHMDQGSVNRSCAVKKFFRETGIEMSMSRKGKSGDNAPTEGFFGRLKQMWFNKTDFTGYDYERFVKELDEFLTWYAFRIKKKSAKSKNMLCWKKVA
jgi:transposase InsO family protein